MKKKQKNKKVNKLNIEECQNILQNLKHQKDSLYYNHVLNHYRKLLPSMEFAHALGKINSSTKANMI